MEKIAVLLAAYNGRQWIDDQLQSILNQKEVDVDIYISVDLSVDGTYEYLQTYYNFHENIFILPYGEKYGSAGKNFYRLIKEVQLNNYNYLAFSDQDDIWHPRKINQAICVIKEKKSDAYSCNVTAFWENGRERIINKAQKQVEYDYLFEAAGPGCTYVFTKEIAIGFKEFLLTKPEAQKVTLHDWLLYAFARNHDFKWYIDNHSYMQYRQHSQNEVGANNTVKAWLKRIELVRKGWYRGEVQKIIILFGNDKDKLLAGVLTNNYIDKIKLALNTNRFRRRLRDRFTLSAFLLLNWF